MLALKSAALFSTLAISIILHFLKRWTHEMLEESQDNKANNNDPFCSDRIEKPIELVVRRTYHCHKKSDSKAKALLIEAERSPHPQTEICKEALRRTQHLTIRLSGARSASRHVVQFCTLHSFAPRTGKVMPSAMALYLHRRLSLTIIEAARASARTVG
jgi:hypothetical protein